MARQRSLEVIRQAEYVTIGELVRLTDVRYSTLKFYTEEGMLPAATAGRKAWPALPASASCAKRASPCRR